jgi:anti-sigma B factor antagonist
VFARKAGQTVSNFSLLLKTDQDVTVIVPKGYVNDLGAETLEQASEQVLDKGLKKLVVNFSDMQYINSIGASVFIGIVQKTIENDGQLCFTNMKKIHQDVFEMLGITKYVRVFKEERDALSFLNEKR